MKWSRFVHAFPRAGILWHSIKLEKFQADSMLLNNFSRNGFISPKLLGVKNYKKLISQNFIVVDSDDSEECLTEVIELGKKPLNFQAMYLILTTKCNLKCSYCLYNSIGSGSLAGRGRHMSKDIALQAIELFSQETSKNNRSDSNYWEEITFYGGEPLLNKSCLESAVSHIREMQNKGKIWKGLHFVLNTNGTLLSDELLEFIASEQIEVQVSIDGPRLVHDRFRIFRSGQGSFDVVISGLNKMKKTGVDFIPLLTITEANINSLADCVEWLCHEFSIKRYGLNLLMHTGGKIDPDYGRKAAVAMKKVHETAKAFGAVDKMYEGSFDAFSSGSLASQSCGAGRKLVIFPDGSIHVCQALEGSGITSMGSLSKFKPESQNRIYWSRRNRFRNEVCLECPAIGGCGGGCGSSAYNAEGDAHGIDPNHCKWMKAVFKMWMDGLCR